MQDKNGKKLKLGDPVHYNNQEKPVKLKQFTEFIGIKINNNRLNIKNIEEKIKLADVNIHPEYFI